MQRTPSAVPRRLTPSACPATIPGERERERKPLSQGRYEVFSWMWKAPVEENLEAPVRSSFSRWFCLAFRTLRHEGFVIANENILRRHDLDLHRNHFSDASWIAICEIIAVSRMLEATLRSIYLKHGLFSHIYSHRVLCSSYRCNLFHSVFRLFLFISYFLPLVASLRFLTRRHGGWWPEGPYPICRRGRCILQFLPPTANSSDIEFSLDPQRI